MGFGAIVLGAVCAVLAGTWLLAERVVASAEKLQDDTQQDVSLPDEAKEQQHNEL
jgi:hypothetical protein